MILIPHRGPQIHIKEIVRKWRRPACKDARRMAYPNRRSPFVPCLLSVKTILK